jgi:hypothetical protein
MGGVKALAVFALAAFSLQGADLLQVFGREWSVPTASDWKIDRDGDVEVLRLVQGREPLPAPTPRRPFQFALTGAGDYSRVTVEADVKPTAKSLLIVVGYRDEAHFDYVHFSTDTGTAQPVHNGVFHVYGGERVRISNPAGPASFAASGKWYRVTVTHDTATGEITGTVDGKPIPAVHAVDLSLGGGRVGIGSFNETGEFRNVRIAMTGAGAEARK